MLSIILPAHPHSYVRTGFIFSVLIVLIQLHPFSFYSGYFDVTLGDKDDDNSLDIIFQLERDDISSITL